MDVHLSHGFRTAIGQLRTSSHQLQIEIGRWADVEAEDWICQLCEKHYVCQCTVYYDIRGRYHCLFREGFGPLRRIMQYEDQRCLGSFLSELRRRRAAIMRERSTARSAPPRQREITEFFRAPPLAFGPASATSIPPVPG
eukprot:c14736_g1_i1 orf=2-418(-)